MALIKDISIGMSVNADSFVTGIKAADKAIVAFSASAKRMLKNVGSIVPAFGALTAGATAFGAVKSSISTAIELEKAITGLSKASDLDGGALETMKAQLFGLSTELKGVPLEDILSIATNLAKMGVANDSLVEQTRGVAMLSTALDDLPADQVADQIGKLNAIFKLGNKGALQMGSALDKIADSGLSSASGILDVTARIAGTAKAMNLGAGESMAMAAALLDTGTQSEQAASALNNLLMNMVAVGNHADFAKTAGVSVEEFGRLVADKPIKAVEAFLGGLQKLGAASQLEALEGIGIKAQERQSALQKLSQQTEKLAEYTALAADEFQNMRQIQDGYAKTAQQTAAAWTTFDNNIKTVKETFASSFLPAINAGLEAIGDKLKMMNDGAAFLKKTLASATSGTPAKKSKPTAGGIGLDLLQAGPLAMLDPSFHKKVFGLARGNKVAEAPKIPNAPGAAAKQEAIASQAHSEAIESGGPSKEAKKAAEKAAKAAEAARKRSAAKAARDAAAAQKRLTEQARDVIESTRTPMEQYQSRLGELKTLLGAKAIDSTTFNRADMAARESIFGSSEATFAGAATRGSQEAYSSQLRFAAQGQSKDEPMKEVAKEAPKQTDLLRQVVTGLAKLADRAGTASAELFDGL